MENIIPFTVAKISKKEVEFINEKTEELTDQDELNFRGNNYDYKPLNLNKIAILSKKNREALNDLYVRLSSMFLSYSNAACKVMFNFTREDIYSKFLETTIAAITVYETSKGSFLHLLRKMCKNALKFMRTNEAIRYKRDLHYFGQKVVLSAEQTYLLDVTASENYSDMSEAIQLKLDLEEYMSKLDGIEKKILSLYIDGFRLKEIALLAKCSQSTASLKLSYMLDELKELHRKKLI